MRQGKQGPCEPSSPMFEPQWIDRTMEAEDPDFEPEDECRLCACTWHSPCAEGCFWVEGDLCSNCSELMEQWPVLLLCDGYGIAAHHAFASRGEAHAFEPT